MQSISTQNTPLPCQGLALLEVPYREVKVLINARGAKIFSASTQHKDNSDSSPLGLYYTGTGGNCLAGFIRMADGEAHVDLRATEGLPAPPEQVLTWVTRLMKNEHFNTFQLKEVKLAGRILFQSQSTAS